jgi:ribose transport system permease protein
VTRPTTPWQRSFTPFGLALLLFIVYVLKSGGFTSIAALGIFNDALPLALAAVGETFVVLTNGIDLSVGSVITLSNVTVATLAQGHSSVLAIAAALAIGAGAGVLNGLIVNYVRLAPLIATLATSSIFLGIALFILPNPGGVIPTWLSTWTSGSTHSIPYAAIWLLVLLAIGWGLLNRTTFGVKVRALGGNEAASWSAGIRVNRMRLLAYLASGLAASFAGIVLAGLTQSGDPTIGNVYVLNTIAAVVVGGTSLAGGVGTAAGSVLGALSLSLISAVLLVSGLSTNYQYVVTGAIVIGALLVHAAHDRIGSRAPRARAVTAAKT